MGVWGAVGGGEESVPSWAESFVKASVIRSSEMSLRNYTK